MSYVPDVAFRNALKVTLAPFSISVGKDYTKIITVKDGVILCFSFSDMIEDNFAESALGSKSGNFIFCVIFVEIGCISTLIGHSV